MTNAATLTKGETMRLTDNQLKTAAADIAAKTTKQQITLQINYYNQPNTINNYSQLDDLYAHQMALRFKD